MSSAHPLLRRVATAGLGLSLLAALPAVPVAAHGDGWNAVIHVTVPSTAAAGTSVTSKVVVKLLVDTHHDHALIGSLQVAPPAGFQLTAATAKKGARSLSVSTAGGAVTLDDLDLRTAGQTIRLRLTSTVRCGTAGMARWTVTPREAAQFSDTSGRQRFGRDATSRLRTDVAGCSLAFLRQPAFSGTGTTVTSVAADPSGSKVAVQLLDGNGQPSSQSGIPVSIGIASGTGAGGASLGGTTADSTNGNGVAAFSPTIDKPGRGYRFAADAGAGITGTTSAAFDIAGVAVTCSGTCEGTQQKGSTTASITADTSGGLLALTLGLDDVSCDNEVNHYYQASSEPLLFDVTSGTGRTVVTVRIDAANVDRKVDKYKVCFSSPTSSFKNYYRKPIAAGEAGVLPRCPHHFGPHPDVRPAHDHDDPIPVDYQACMEDRWKDADGNVYVRFSVPPGDPRAKI